MYSYLDEEGMRVDTIVAQRSRAFMMEQVRDTAQQDGPLGSLCAGLIIAEAQDPTGFISIENDYSEDITDIDGPGPF